MQRFCVKFIFIAKLNGGILTEFSSRFKFRRSKGTEGIQKYFILFFVLINIILSFFFISYKKENNKPIIK